MISFFWQLTDFYGENLGLHLMHFTENIPELSNVCNYLYRVILCHCTLTRRAGTVLIVWVSLVKIIYTGV